ncbi:MAG: hypothetical protein ACKORB_09010 [Opitutia bacterium]
MQTRVEDEVREKVCPSGVTGYFGVAFAAGKGCQKDYLGIGLLHALFCVIFLGIFRFFSGGNGRICRLCAGGTDLTDQGQSKSYAGPFKHGDGIL